MISSTIETDSRATDPARSGVTTQPVTFPRVITSEWIKFRTLRSSVAVLGAAFIGMIVVAMLVAYNTRHLTPDIDANDHVQSSTLQGYYLGELLIGALGVLFVTGEYSTGMIRSTFGAVPRRLPVLWAKLVVFVVATTVSMIAACIIGFVSSQAFIAHYRPAYALTDPGVLRVVIGTGVYLTLIGTIGAALGWIIRSTPGALVAYFGAILVIPVIFGSVLGSWGKHVAQFLPSQAGAAFISSLPDTPSLAPWTGIGVLIVWVIVAVAVAVIQLRRRDA